MLPKDGSSKAKVTCVYHAIVNNNMRVNELKRVLQEHGAGQFGIAAYYMVCSVLRKMHMNITEYEADKIFYKLRQYFIFDKEVV